MDRDEKANDQWIAMLETIKSSKKDEVINFTKAGISTIPFPCMGVFAEIFSTVIPNQRLDRVATYLKFLSHKVREHEVRLIRENEYTRDLIEQSVQAATKALSDQRNKYLASFTYSSLDCDEDIYSLKKNMLQILSELTDMEVEILHYLIEKKWLNTQLKYSPKSVTGGAYQSMSEPEKEQYQDSKLGFESMIRKLERHGLVSLDRNRLKEQMLKSQNEVMGGFLTSMEQHEYNATPLARRLLNDIGLID
ncbi:hypothetical protein ACOJR9_11875 [Alteromonas sp. A081]|uniref:hypothetical protein n=1 Tax=Alteromonas sp. A081 TaxID=3410269 RepID=UPI003B97F462